MIRQALTSCAIDSKAAEKIHRLHSINQLTRKISVDCRVDLRHQSQFENWNYGSDRQSQAASLGRE
jgi:hypothetical protein